MTISRVRKMKLLLKPILFVWATGIGFAQVGPDSGWTWQNPQPTGNLLHSVVGLNSRGARHRPGGGRSMIAVGTQGTILRTTDGGAGWTHVAAGSSSDLYSVCFMDAYTGVAVGDQGTILRTLDGGVTWTIQSSNTTLPCLAYRSAMPLSERLSGKESSFGPRMAVSPGPVKRPARITLSKASPSSIPTLEQR